jgi:hypothetical protein
LGEKRRKHGPANKLTIRLAGAKIYSIPGLLLYSMVLSIDQGIYGKSKIKKSGEDFLTS